MSGFFFIIFAIIAIPFWILFGPIYIILKTIATIWQPYFYKKQSEKWDRQYQECQEKGIWIDYPPSYGTFLGVKPWSAKDYE